MSDTVLLTLVHHESMYLLQLSTDMLALETRGGSHNLSKFQSGEESLLPKGDFQSE